VAVVSIANVIERILPASVATAEAYEDVAAPSPYPEEAAVVANAVDKRSREFTTVRHCARTALGRLGIAPVPLLPGRRGAPRWPAGVVGSMTHCEGYRAAAVATAEDIAAIGVDAEPNAPLPAGVLESVSRAEERIALAALTARHPEVHWDRLLFSAKESVFKAWYPVTARELDFSEASITFDPDRCAFTARLLVPGPRDGYDGRYAVERGLVVTAIAVPA
jgi:4'-phosphopantetheinyl transferase EntD